MQRIKPTRTRTIKCRGYNPKHACWDRNSLIVDISVSLFAASHKCSHFLKQSNNPPVTNPVNSVQGILRPSSFRETALV
ncbi:hypothetical protein CEXT_575171 [Caerostris extrusa]|uniref:Uncharacterized protein n=1 Tax=Caerostris extrusa TaxID=172846 RepID=A0AAV4VVK2_CAEEX|nr:hypothetical protein CEXT_575171 [Caerostris extrusa]